MLAILNSFNAHNFPIFQPILMIIISKFKVRRALSDKTYLYLWLLSPLTLSSYVTQATTTKLPGRVAQSVTCLATDACLTADPGVASSIPIQSHTFVEIDHEMISTVILPLPLIQSRRVIVSYKRKYVHELLVNRLFKPAQEKCG